MSASLGPNGLSGTATIKQVKQAYKQDIFTTTSTSYVSVTGLSVNITLHLLLIKF